MKRNMYSVFDAKSMTFGMPMFVVNDAVMFRMMKDEMAKESMLSAHPEDFAVYYLGVFEDEFGKVEPVSPVVIFQLSAFVEVKC